MDYTIAVSTTLGMVYGVPSIGLTYKTMKYVSLAWLVGLDGYKAAHWLSEYRKNFLDMP